MTREFSTGHLCGLAVARVIFAEDRSGKDREQLLGRLRLVEQVVLKVPPIDVVVGLNLRRRVGVMECVFGAELGFRQRLCRVRGVAPTRIEQSHLMAAAELDSTRSLGLFVETSKDPTAAAMSVQAYAQIVDKTLTYDDLPALGAS